MSLMIALHLLDPSQSYHLQSWEFSVGDTVKVGRSEENQVQIGHPSVSRSHASIHFEEGSWRLNVSSQNGVIVDGNKVMEATLENGTIFQLSSRGPFLKFSFADEMDGANNQNETAYLSHDSTPLFESDTAQRDKDVQEIVESDYFDRLQEMANQLRKRN
jgi:pSer/pThr/pTyr-binding forkhead associated (FHA) protein